jgi:hypothetical protein
MYTTTGMKLVHNLFAIMVIIVLMSGCASNVISIDAKDSVDFATLETSIPLSKQRGDRIKLRGSRTSGDYSQTVPDGKMIIIEDTQIQGPTDVSGTADLTYASVSYGSEDILSKGGMMPHELSFLVYIGVAQTNMDTTLLHEGTTYATNDRTTELYMQLGGAYAVTPSFKAGLSWATSVGADLTGISEVDLRLGYLLFSHLEVIGGYRWLEYNYLVEEDDSVIRVRFRGPFIGLNIPF